MATNCYDARSLSVQFPKVKSINLGGGLGIVEKPGQHPLDFTALDASLLAVKSQNPQLEIWLEPGRFLLRRAGLF